MLWQIALLEKPGYSNQLIKPARKHLYDLLRTQDREVIESYILNCLNIIESKTGASV